MPADSTITKGNSANSTVGVLMSGGVDSGVLVGLLLREARPVVPFYVQTGCLWEISELMAVHRFLAAIAGPNLVELVVLELPVSDLYHGHWSVSGQSVPDASTPDEAVYLPGRNPLLLLKPALWCQMNGVAELAIATLANNPFDDAQPNFFQSFETMLRMAVGGSPTIVRPFEQLSKSAVVALGCDLPLELTFSCLAPVDGLHCGRCNKCGERRQALGQLKGGDRTQYANL